MQRSEAPINTRSRVASSVQLPGFHAARDVREGLRRVASDLGAVYVANGLVAFLFAASGPVAIVLAVGATGGLSESDIASWLFGGYFLSALLGIAFSLFYRQPLVFAWTIPGTVLVGQALTHLSWPQVLGAFHVVGLILLLFGLSGWVRRAMLSVPMPIVMAMVVGVLLRFGVDLVHAFRDDILVALPMTAAFLALTALPRLGRMVPPLIGALGAGGIAVAVLGAFKPPSATLLTFVVPNVYLPEFSWAAMVELVVPLTITVLVAQNAQGIAVLTANGHRPPINAITAACGLWSVLTALVGTVSTSLTGPASALVSSSGEKARHYTAALVACVLLMSFALLAPFFTRLMLGTPPAFIATLAGLAMLRVLASAMQTSFRERFSLGAMVCFLVTIADVPIFNIGSAFWGLVLGLVTAWLLERGDFAAAAAKCPREAH